MMGSGKPQLHAKFAVAILTRCRNIKGEPQNLGSSSSPRQRPLFLVGGILWWALANTSCSPILKSPASAVAKILKRNPKYWGAPLAQVHFHFFYKMWFYDGPWQTPAACWNMKGKLPKFGELPRPSHAHFFFCLILWWYFANPSCVPKLKSLAPAFSEILNGKSKNFRELP